MPKFIFSTFIRTTFQKIFGLYVSKKGELVDQDIEEMECQYLDWWNVNYKAATADYLKVHENIRKWQNNMEEAPFCTSIHL